MVRDGKKVMSGIVLSLFRILPRCNWLGMEQFDSRRVNWTEHIVGARGIRLEQRNAKPRGCQAE